MRATHRESAAHRTRGGQKAQTTMTTTTKILAAITTVTVSLDPHSADLIDTARFAAELTKVFPAAEVEVTRATSHETRLDARGEIDGADVRIVARGRSYDVLGDVDAASDAARAKEKSNV